MKKRLTLIGIATVFIVAMAGGYLTGYLFQLRWFDAWHQGELSAWIIDISGLSNDIALIDSGDIHTLRADMNERIDLRIYSLDHGFDHDWSSRHALAASKVLAQVHAQRQEYPFMNDDRELASSVEALLHDAAERWSAHQEANAATPVEQRAIADDR